LFGGQRREKLNKEVLKAIFSLSSVNDDVEVVEFN